MMINEFGIVMTKEQYEAVMYVMSLIYTAEGTVWVEAERLTAHAGTLKKLRKMGPLVRQALPGGIPG